MKQEEQNQKHDMCKRNIQQDIIVKKKQNKVMTRKYT